MKKKVQPLLLMKLNRSTSGRHIIQYITTIVFKVSIYWTNLKEVARKYWNINKRQLSGHLLDHLKIAHAICCYSLLNLATLSLSLSSRLLKSFTFVPVSSLLLAATERGGIKPLERLLAAYLSLPSKYLIWIWCLAILWNVQSERLMWICQSVCRLLCGASEIGGVKKACIQLPKACLLNIDWK